MTDFSVHGPFVVPVRAGRARRIDQAALDDFWDTTVGRDLGESCGCYVFAKRHGRGSLPVYVGMSHRQTFDSECFNARNQLALNEELESHGRLVLHLLRREGRAGAEKAIRELEKYLIEVAADRNPEIVNKRGVSGPSWAIVGIGRGRRRGRQPSAATDLARTLAIPE